MRQPFVPVDFKPPQGSVLGEYHLIPIQTKDVQEDLETLLKNADTITTLRGGNGSKEKWPYIFTLEENAIDIAWLEMCARNKQLFSYIIRNEKNSYSGCVYIYPIELYFPEKADEFDVDFSFWIVQSEFDKGLYQNIYNLLYTWLEHEWPFPMKRIYLRNKLEFIRK